MRGGNAPAAIPSSFRDLCFGRDALTSDIDTAYKHLAADAHAVLSIELKRKEYDAMRQRSDVRSLTVT